MRIIDCSSDVCSSERLGRGGADQHAGAPADAIEHLSGHIVLHQHAERLHAQPMIEWPARRYVANRELDVCDAVGRNHVFGSNVRHNNYAATANRTEERRVGKAWVRTVRYRWAG